MKWHYKALTNDGTTLSTINNILSDVKQPQRRKRDLTKQEGA